MPAKLQGPNNKKSKKSTLKISSMAFEVQLRDLLKDLETIINDTFPKNIRLHFPISKEPWIVLGDPEPETPERSRFSFLGYCI